MNKYKINKIIFIESQPIAKMIEHNFHLNATKKVSSTFEYWDIKKIYTKNYPKVELLECTNYREFSYFNSLKEAIIRENIKNTIFIVQDTLRFDNIGLYRLLTKNKFTLYFFQIGTMPHTIIPFNIRLKNINIKLIKRICKKLLLKLYLSTGLIKHYDYVFAAGEKSIEMHKNHSKVIPINLPEYDVLFSDGKSARIVNEKYCVFLDQYLPHHPDYPVLNEKGISSNKYYSSLNKFFDLLENKFNINVIIAAHPKADYKINPFNKRTIIKYRTQQLVEFCEFAIAYTSISICNAVIYGKPLIFFYTDEIKKKKLNEYYSVKKLGETLNSPVFNIDKIKSENIIIPKVDKEKYKVYKYNYIVSHASRNIPSSDIIMKHFTNLYKD